MPVTIVNPEALPPDSDQAATPAEPTGQAAYEALPDPGHARGEELRRRTDNLQARAETLSAEQDVHRMNPKAFEPDAEILRFLERGDLVVRHASPAYRYKWVYRDQFTRFGGRHVLVEKLQGWQTVLKGDPEAEGYSIASDNTVYCGDVLLMKIRLDLWVRLEKLRHAKNERLRGGARSSVEADAVAGMADRANHANKQLGGNGVIIKDQYSQEEIERLHNKSQAATVTENYQNKWIKEGRMPGVPAPK